MSYYRPNDPRFRRRLNEIGQTLESANETAQSSLYIFGQNYIKPCFHSIGQCLSSCYDASCPGLPLTQRERLRRGRGRGRAELNFDFYDDWDEDENDGLLGGWGNDEFDRLTGGNYGTVAAQPRRERGMTYGSGKRGRRKSTVLPGEEDPTVIPGSSTGLLGRLFGGKPLRYKPSAAGLQEHPGQRRLGHDLTEGEALLAEHEAGGRKHRRARSGTVQSQDTSDSYSSRGDIFPSDGEDDAVPLDDEFAMVLERRNTQSGPETESTSTGSRERRRGKRPSAGSRTSTRRTVSTRSTQSGQKNRSRASSGAAPEAPVEEDIPSLTELKQEEQRIENLEESSVERRRQEAQRLASERGLAEDAILSSKEATPEHISPTLAPLSSKEATPEHTSPAIAPVSRAEEPSQLPTPLDTEDEEDQQPQQQQTETKEHHDDDTQQPGPKEEDDQE